ncbi:DUF6913 domain-containing protein [Aureispira anguillae]|uniref:Uncharacterized protein n=1 Tax=Aureispira anguillae TaxID=2864201 RepID=A0A916DP52_9BACT|nr:hypothetical protein [Aureispira anguillae]BDS10314.1 hypothetical protein AsAng_0010220 [Aureispira anguillae]
MSLLSGLKESLYQRKLKQCIQANKKRSACNFDTARSIGLIFNASNEAEAKIVLGYKRELQSQRKKVKLIAYKDANQLTEEEAYPCFCNKDLGLNQTPKKQEVLDFIHEPFDLLIALHVDNCQPLEYIAAASAAKFRIGHYREDKTDFYDFMVYGKSKSLRALIQQMENYLKKIQ